MEPQNQARHDITGVVSTTFVTSQETEKLAAMLAIAVEDLDRVSGGALAAQVACCSCHCKAALA